MEQPEFIGLQLSALVRGERKNSAEVVRFLASVPFQQTLQEKLSEWLEQSLHEAKVPFDEVIISLDVAAQKAKPIEAAKPSLLSRLFGGS